MGFTITPGAIYAAKAVTQTRALNPLVLSEHSPGLLEFMKSSYNRIAVVAANRVGKTYHAAMKLSRYMIDNPGVRCRLVGPTAKKINRIHGRYMFRFLRKYLAPNSTWNPGTGFNRGNLIMLSNGSSCELMSYDQDVDAHSGDSMHVVWLDEPPPPGIFEEAEARVFDTDGSVWVTMTAVGRPVKWLREVVEAGVKDGDWEEYHIALSARNCPWYTQAQIDKRVRQVARMPSQYNQRILGHWDGISEDRKFTGFQDACVVECRPTQGWPRHDAPINVILSVDHGEGAGHAVWGALGYQIIDVTKYKVHIAVRLLCEWTNPTRMSVRKEAMAVKGMLEEVNLGLKHIKFAVGDTNVMSKSEAGRTFNQEFEIEFARLMGREPHEPKIIFRDAIKGADSVNLGVGLCNQLFDTEIPGGYALTIHGRCTKTLEAVAHWAGKNDDLKHPADMLRYGVKMICHEVGYSDADLRAD